MGSNGGEGEEGNVMDTPDESVAEPSQEWLQGYFGDAFPQISLYAQLLIKYGEERGLIGPREVPRLWRRHIVNSAAVSQYIPPAATVADVGSGAGLPGIVLAAMHPDVHFTLIEPMQRRIDWLEEVVGELKLENVRLWTGQAQEYHDGITFDVVTARAVAALNRLTRWCGPLVASPGRLVLQKGARAETEVDEAAPVLRKLGFGTPTVHCVDIFQDGDITRVVEIPKFG